jgi:hypothetical protein
MTKYEPIDSAFLIRRLNQLRKPYEIDITSEDYYVGVSPEMLDKNCKCKLELGQWYIHDYYDHLWSLLAIHKDKVGVTLKFDRETEETTNYGFLKSETVNDFLENSDGNGNDNDAVCFDDLEIVSNDEVWTFGRGSEGMLVFTHQTNNLIDAFLITDESFIEYIINDELDQFS